MNNTLLSFSYIIEISKRSILRGSKLYTMEISDETKIKELNSSIREHSTWGREQQEMSVLATFKFWRLFHTTLPFLNLWRTNENWKPHLHWEASPCPFQACYEEMLPWVRHQLSEAVAENEKLPTLGISNGRGGVEQEWARWQNGIWERSSEDNIWNCQWVYLLTYWRAMWTCKAGLSQAVFLQSFGRKTEVQETKSLLKICFSCYRSSEHPLQLATVSPLSSAIGVLWLPPPTTHLPQNMGHTPHCIMLHPLLKQVRCKKRLIQFLFHT